MQLSVRTPLVSTVRHSSLLPHVLPRPLAKPPRYRDKSEDAAQQQGRLGADAPQIAGQPPVTPGVMGVPGAAGMSASSLPGPYSAPATTTVPVSPFLGSLCNLTGLGWTALAAAAVVAPTATLSFLFPHATDTFGPRLLTVLWGALVLPLAATAFGLQDAVESQLMGTPGANQLNAGLLLGSGVLLLVLVQGVSLRHTPLNVLVGGLSGLGLGVAAWMTARLHPWSLPLPNISGVLSSVMSLLTPHTWASAAYSAISVSLLGTGAALLRTWPDGPSLVLGAAHSAGNLTVFTSRAGAAGMLAAGVLCLMLKEAADRKLLATPFAARMNRWLAGTSGLVAAALSALLWGNLSTASRSLTWFLAGQTGLFLWAAAAAVWPLQVQASRPSTTGGVGLPGSGMGSTGAPGGMGGLTGSPAGSTLSTAGGVRKTLFGPPAGSESWTPAQFFTALAQRWDPGF